MKNNSQTLVNILKNGGIAVIPTDTVYGIVGSALNFETVEKIYKLRKRSGKKPMIILISSIKDLDIFKIKFPITTKKILNKLWPNPVSIILPLVNTKFKYLHRGTNSLAFRIPKDEFLLKLLNQTGPLVAPSANFEGQTPAKSIDEARNYFKDRVYIYIDGGKLDNPPSTLIKIKGNKLEILRQGSINFPGLKVRGVL